jgi:hypothetical protein
MNTRLIISYVFAQVTKGGYGRKSKKHLFHLFARSYSFRPAMARVRYRPRPDADGVTFSFQIGKNKKSFKWDAAYPWHEIWILQDQETYYFIPSHVLGELCLRPSSYRHAEYDPDHRLVHINTQNHQCCYTDKQADFSPYYRATFDTRRIHWSPAVKALLKELGH